jgi:hypothetical protein
MHLHYEQAGEGDPEKSDEFNHLAISFLQGGMS